VAAEQQRVIKPQPAYRESNGRMETDAGGSQELFPPAGLSSSLVRCRAL
jgi:hypothetical protein